MVQSFKFKAKRAPQTTLMLMATCSSRTHTMQQSVGSDRLKLSRTTSGHGGPSDGTDHFGREHALTRLNGTQHSQRSCPTNSRRSEGTVALLIHPVPYTSRLFFSLKCRRWVPTLSNFAHKLPRVEVCCIFWSHDEQET